MGFALTVRSLHFDCVVVDDVSDLAMLKLILTYRFSMVHGCLTVIMNRSAVICTDVRFSVGKAKKLFNLD